MNLIWSNQFSINLNGKIWDLGVCVCAVVFIIGNKIVFIWVFVYVYVCAREWESEIEKFNFLFVCCIFLRICYVPSCRKRDISFWLGSFFFFFLFPMRSQTDPNRCRYRCIKNVKKRTKKITRIWVTKTEMTHNHSMKRAFDFKFPFWWNSVIFFSFHRFLFSVFFFWVFFFCRRFCVSFRCYCSFLLFWPFYFWMIEKKNLIFSIREENTNFSIITIEIILVIYSFSVMRFILFLFFFFTMFFFLWNFDEIRKM